MSGVSSPDAEKSRSLDRFWSLTVLAKEIQERLFYCFVIGMHTTALLFEVFNIYYTKPQT